LFNVNVFCKDTNYIFNCLNSTFVFFLYYICLIFFFSSLLIVINVKSLILFYISLICYTFNKNILFKSLLIVITLFLIEYKSNNISLICYTFDNNTLKKLAIVDKISFNKLIILLFLIKHKSNNISLIYYMFNNNTLTRLVL